MADRWRELGPGVFARRHRSLDLNVGLVIGAGSTLLVDSRCHRGEAMELRESIRRLTATAVTLVVNTHAHFDHCFGNEVFAGAQIWGHRGCRDSLERDGESQRRTAMKAFPDLAGGLETVRITPPDKVVDVTADIDVGGRAVELWHPGPGHTDHDLVVAVADAGVLFAGDLVEEGGPPQFDDAWPERWPSTLTRLLECCPTIVVPGHGAVVDAGFVAAQRDQLAAVAELCGRVRRGEIDAVAAARRGPYPEPSMRAALGRIGADLTARDGAQQ